MIRAASCHCGQLNALCSGEPVRISICHCIDCQRRSGSAFSAQARFPDDCVELTGDAREYVRTGESGARARFRFCPQCGGTIAYTNDTMPGLTAVPLGCFADPDFPQPHYSVFEERQHGWLSITGEGIEHFE